MIIDEYSFNEYDIKPETIKNITLTIEKVMDYRWSNKDEEEKRSLVYRFFEEVHIGKYGVLYRQPSDIVSKFYKFADNHTMKMP